MTVQVTIEDPPELVVHITDPAPEIVVELAEVGLVGPAGPEGPAGPAGPSGDLTDMADLTLIFQNGLI